ncbi:MAG: CvpA family protein [Desulfobacteraceae bacterium]|jgi:membrane protein required for colicin V production
MNLLDIVLAAIAAYCIIRGVFRGLIKELSSIVGAMGGFYLAYTYYPLLAKNIAHWVTDTGYQRIISFLIIFVVVFLAVSFAGIVIKYLMNIAFLGWTDRICGLFFGSVKGILIITVLLLVLTTFLPKNAAVIKRSWVAHRIIPLSAFLIKITPDEMKHSFGAKAKELKKSW